MKYTARTSPHQEIDDNPKTPFIKDLKKDMSVIDLHYSNKEGNRIKKLMINEILNSIK